MKQVMGVDFRVHGIEAIGLDVGNSKLLIAGLSEHKGRVLGGDLWKIQDDRLSALHINFALGSSDPLETGYSAAVNFIDQNASRDVLFTFEISY